jgi:predicted  nucleic acid-binding Zn ribbon protein
MKEYAILRETNIAELSHNVSKLLGKGWKLTGGIAIETAIADTFYYQAMTRTTNEHGDVL